MYAVTLLGCDGDCNADVGSGGGVVAVRAYMCGTRGSCVLSSAGDVQEMCVVRGVCGVCDMCMCLARGGVGGVGVSGCQDWVWAFPIMEEHGESGLCVCFLWWCGWCWGRMGGRFGPGSWRVGNVLSVCVVSLDYRCRWQVQVFVYCARRIPEHLRCTPCSILLHLIDICFLSSICLWQISQI